ncbi:MAG: alginate export family protein [Bacteroidales bacterium]|nr:alginate export family protein [Bacteroidales bacterium]MDD4217141.1 alginate export family protein [Bacteroidales bacterium]
MNTFAQLKISAELRTRGEAINAYQYLPDTTTETKFFVTQRTRIIANYKKDFYETQISIQDVRFWGGEDNFTKAGVWSNTNGLDIYEAWAKFNLNENHFLKIGRQELRYDDERLLSWRNWNQYGITYDAFVYGFRKKDWKLDLGLSYNSWGTADKNNSYFDGATTKRMKTLNFLHLNKEFDKFSASFNLISAGYHKGNTTNVIYLTNTYGLYLKYKNNSFMIDGNAYMQSGKSYEGKDIKGAYLLTLNGETYLLDKKLSLKAGVDYFSGADGTNSDELYNTQHHNFNLMYGARYLYYGNQNMFTLMDTHTKNAGLTDIHFGLNYKQSEKHIFDLTYHIFSTSEKVLKEIDPIQNERIYYNQSLGSEIDMVYTYKINKELVVKSGLSYYFTNSTIESFKGIKGDVGLPFWGWIMLSFKPTLFEK